MMIELTRRVDRESVYINARFIVEIRKRQGGGSWVTSMAQKEGESMCETPIEILRLMGELRDADPRDPA